MTSRRTQRRAVRATAVLLGLLAVVLGGDSLWERSVQVPGIVAGTPVVAAESALQDAGLRAVRERGASDEVAAGRVLAQRPAAGSEVDAGSQVVLVVSTGPAVVTAPAPSAPGGTEGEGEGAREDEPEPDPREDEDDRDKGDRGEGDQDEGDQDEGKGERRSEHEDRDESEGGQ